MSHVNSEEVGKIQPTASAQEAAPSALEGFRRKPRVTHHTTVIPVHNPKLELEPCQNGKWANLNASQPASEGVICMKARFSSSELRELRCRPMMDSYCTLKPSVLRLGGNGGGAEVFGKEWGHDKLTTTWMMSKMQLYFSLRCICKLSRESLCRPLCMQAEYWDASNCPVIHSPVYTNPTAQLRNLPSPHCGMW